MSISGYEFLSIVQVRDKDAAAPMDFSADYVAVLEAVRSAIAQNHAQELAAALDDESAAQVLQGLIMKYTTDALAGQDYDRQELAERVFQDMAGLGILTPYLYDPAVEEININGYANIEIIYADRTEFLHGSQAFPSLRTGSVIPSLEQFQRRVGSDDAFRLCSTLIEIERGVDQTATLDYLADDMARSARLEMQKQLSTRPAAMRLTYLPAVAVCVILILYVLVVFVMNQVDTLF